MINVGPTVIIIFEDELGIVLDVIASDVKGEDNLGAIGSLQ